MRDDCEELLRGVVHFHLKLGITEINDAKIPAIVANLFIFLQYPRSSLNTLKTTAR